MMILTHTDVRIPEKLRNVDLTVYEKNDGVGGVWYVNSPSFPPTNQPTKKVGGTWLRLNAEPIA
jgi:hypothetical protein